MLSMFAWTDAASAHEVTSMSATCSTVTVNFSGFPSDGVMVHIAATVEGHGSVSTDTLVKGAMTGTLDISGNTSALFGASAAVDVDVTWTFQGAQHAHETLHVTCGSATTTTTHATTTTTHATTTTVGATTTTAPTTSTTVQTATTLGGSGSTTTTSGGTSAVTVGSSTGGTAGGSVIVAAESAPPGGTATSGGSLPFTGSPTGPLAGLGALMVAAGASVLARNRRHS